MNDFDILLEQQLSDMLDPVVATLPPSRRGRRSRNEPVLTIVSSAPELAVETVVVTAPVVAPPLGR